VAASGPRSTRLAASNGDGLIGTAPDRELVSQFERDGGRGKPKYAQVHVCWAATEEEGRRTAHKHWPNSALKGELGQELPMPRHFEQAVELVREEDVGDVITCGPDPERHVEAIRKFLNAGYDHVWVHQVGPDQEGFFAFYGDEVLPKLL
jgi:G6PDH family F420-dependent oxidoreductase